MNAELKNGIEVRRKRLVTLVGTWDGTGTLAPNPWAASGGVRMTWTVRADQTGYHLLHQYVETRADGSVFELNGMLLADPNDDGYLWIAIDSYGFSPIPPAKGKWLDGTLLLEKSTQKGKGIVKLSLRDDTLGWETGFCPPGGTYTLVMKGKLVRRT
jgi:hypothetical protein